MGEHFAEVLAREEASLAKVTHVAGLAHWRRRVVQELMDPHSPYVLALRQTGEVHDRADFLGRWRTLIAKMVDRLLHSQATATGHTLCAAVRPSPFRQADVAAQETAVLILAALHGGSILSQVAQDPWPLNAALDLALAPLAASGDGAVDDNGTD